MVKRLGTFRGPKEKIDIHRKSSFRANVIRLLTTERTPVHSVGALKLAHSCTYLNVRLYRNVCYTYKDEEGVADRRFSSKIYSKSKNIDRHPPIINIFIRATICKYQSFNTIIYDGCLYVR